MTTKPKGLNTRNAVFVVMVGFLEKLVGFVPVRFVPSGLRMAYAGAALVGVVSAACNAGPSRQEVFTAVATPAAGIELVVSTPYAPTYTPSPMSSLTPEPIPTRTPTVATSPAPTLSPSAIPKPTYPPSPAPYNTPTPGLTPSPTPTPEATPTPAVSPAATPSPSPTPGVVVVATPGSIDEVCTAENWPTDEEVRNAELWQLGPLYSLEDCAKVERFADVREHLIPNSTTTAYAHTMKVSPDIQLHSPFVAGYVNFSYQRGVSSVVNTEFLEVYIIPADPETTKPFRNVRFLLALPVDSVINKELFGISINPETGRYNFDEEKFYWMRNSDVLIRQFGTDPLNLDSSEVNDYDIVFYYIPNHEDTNLLALDSEKFFIGAKRSF